MTRFLVTPAKLIGVLVITFVTLEVLTRVILYISLLNYFNRQIPEPYRTNMKALHLGALFTKSEFRFDPICRYVFRDGFIRGAAGQYNPAKKSNDEIRILCIGDSTTYGDGVDYVFSWPQRLETLLVQYYPQKNIRVLNAGVPGSDSLQIRRIFEKYLIHLSPDIVIWRAGHKLTDEYNYKKEIGFWRALFLRFLYESRLCRFILVLQKKNNMLFEEKNINSNDEQDEDEEEPDDVSADFQMVQEFAKSKGILKVVALDYLRVNYEEGKIDTDYSYYINKDIGPVVRTVGAFREKADDEPLESMFIDTVHMTNLGTELIANEIFQFLKSQNWLEVTSNKSGS